MRQKDDRVYVQDMIDNSNKAIHDYLNVDEDIVWATIKHDLPPLVLELEKILCSKENSENWIRRHEILKNARVIYEQR